MDRETYIKKRKELVDKHPRVMTPGFMRGVRIGLGVFALFMVKVVSGSLPFYRNKCLYDNVIDRFQPLQKYFQNKSTVVAVEVILFALGNLHYFTLAL